MRFGGGFFGWPWGEKTMKKHEEFRRLGVKVWSPRNPTDLRRAGRSKNPMDPHRAGRSDAQLTRKASEVEDRFSGKQKEAKGDIAAE